MREFPAVLLSLALAAPAWAAPKPELMIQTGHSSSLRAAAFSHDGKYLATAGNDRTAVLWDAATGTELRVFKGHGEYLSSIAFSPDGKTLATGAGDATARLWDLATGRELFVLKGHDAYVSAVAFSPDGKLLATAGMDHDARLWDARTGEQLLLLKGHTDHLSDLAFSPNGKLLATASTDGTARLWNTRSGEELRVFKHEKYVLSVSFSPDGKRLATTNDKIVHLWDPATGKETRLADAQGGAANHVAFSPDGKTLAVIGRKGHLDALRLWDAATGAQLREFKDPENPEYGFNMNSVVFSPDGKSLVTTSRRSYARHWDAATGESLREFKGLNATLTLAAFSSDGRFIAAGLFDKTARLWSTATGAETHVLRGHPRQVLALAFSPDGKTLVTGSSDPAARLWDTESGKQTRVLKTPSKWVNSAAFSPDGKLVATGGGDSPIQLWDAATGASLRALEGKTENVRALAFSPDGRRLAAAADVKTVALWDTATGTQLRTIEGNWVSGVVFSPDGLTLATKGSDGTLLYDAVTGVFQRDLAGPDRTTSDVSFSPDGKTVATGGHDRMVRLWDPSTGRQIRVLEGHNDMVESVSFSPDGKFLASAGYDGGIIIWEAATGREVARLFAMEGKGWAVVSPEGFFDGSPDGLRAIRWVVGLKAFPLDAFSEGYYAPGLLARLLAGEPAAAGGALPKLSDSFALPPSVKITTPRAGAVLESEDAEVTVQATDQGGGVDEIRLYHNGKAVSGEARGMKSAGRSQTFRVTLVEGDNAFKAVALSRDRIESNPDEVKVSYAGAQKQAVLHLVVVGINSYKNASMDLNYARPDAQALSDFFAAAPGKLFKEVKTRRLFDSGATKAAILAELSALRSAAPQDVVLIYLAGHGDSAGAGWYFLPHELVYPEREDAVRAQGLSSAEILEAIKQIGAQKVLLMLDACKSGEALRAFASRGVEDRKALSQLARASGVHVVAASTKDQFATEVKELGHGVFTYTLLEGLGGKAAGEGGTVTVRKLLAYVEERLPELTLKHKTQSQYPVVDSRGMDFPVTTGKR